MMGGWHPTQAVGPDGERADVKDVANGLQCRCLCYECGQPVLAKQGPKVRWHFAHHAPTNCRPTPESELHFFAKTLLAEKLWLWIPAVQAKAVGRMEPISDRQQYRFSGVKVEKADGNVRPDLLLVSDRGKVLHVEIYVRHRVDPIKLEKLRGRGISSVEIDLSKLDWDDRGAWNDAILETAPREWLHNARAAKVQKGMEVKAAAEAKAKQQVLDAEYERVAGIWNKVETVHEDPDEHLTEQHDLALKRGFSQKIGHAVKGAACFRVSPAYWQARLVNHFLWDKATASASVFETGDALAYVRDLIWPGLNRVSKETSARMQQDFPAYQGPWHVVHSYLKWLKVQHWMFSKRVGGKQWLPSSSAVHLREEQEASWQLERERKKEVTDWLDMILSNIPEKETSDFDRADWVNWFVTSYNEYEARAFHGAISGMVVSGRQLTDDFRGLPLLAEYERQGVAQEERRVQKERERVARLAQVERDRRISTIEDKALTVLAELAQHWLLAANAQLDGKAPLDLATQSDEGLAHATSELARLQNERREAEAREAAKVRQQAALEKNRLELAALAGKRARDPARAELWCQSPNPKLGGKRPNDYCVDDRALRTCKDIMPLSL
ncbi:competence protein CoiA family protein [Novosphingobium panipatense]|uniref:competence protein CoiA family protein n=1 Tax=Novosphingobium panipatense TaxID=428991 RepID=UPI0039A19FB0